MDSIKLAEKLRKHLLNTVGEKASEEEMKLIDKKIQSSYDKIYDEPDKSESIVSRVYSEELAEYWEKVVANETLISEFILFKKHAQVKSNYKVTSFASGLAVFELFLAKEFVPRGFVTCIDISEGMNKKAKEFAKKLNQKNVKIITASVVKTPLEENSQDIVIARRTGLSKDKKWVDVLKEAHRILKKENNSVFIYTVDKIFNDSANLIKSNLGKANMELVSIEESHGSNRGAVCMIVAKPVLNKLPL